MWSEQEKRELQAKLEHYYGLLRAFPVGPMAETIRDLIAELEQQLRDVEET